MAADAGVEIAAEWLAPEGATSESRKQYGLLRDALEIIRRGSKMPEILVKPQNYKGDHIYDEGRRVILSDSFPGGRIEQRVALLNTLSECLAGVDSYFRRKTATHMPAPRNFFPEFPTQASERVNDIDALFTRFILEDGRKAKVHLMNQKVQVGLLITSVVLRQGQCSMRVLSSLASTIDEPLRVAGNWMYRDVSSGMGAQTTPENRRVFLDLVSAAIYLRLNPVCAQVFDRPENEKLAIQTRRRITELERCFAAFIDHVDPNRKRPQPTLKQFLTARHGMLRMSVCSVLCDYATGELISSSFREPAFLRFMGHHNSENIDRPAGREANGMSRLPTDAGDRITEQAARGAFDETGILADLRHLFKSPRSQWAALLEQKLRALKTEYLADSAPVLITRWVSHLATRSRPGGKRAADGTIKNMVSALGARLLDAWPPQGFSDAVSADDLQEVYICVLESAASSGHEPRLARVIVDFDRFYRNEVRPELKNEKPDLAITGGHYEISANGLSPAEYEQLCLEIYGPRNPFSTDRLRDQAFCFAALAWRLGMRKSEILGLERRDLHWYGRGRIVVRDNVNRDLKTNNSARLVPLDLLVEKERASLRRIFDYALAQDDEAPFFQSDTAGGMRLPDHLIIPGINLLLRRLAHGSPVHPHNLRHSSASCNFMALMAGDVGLERYGRNCPFIADVIKLESHSEKALLNRFHPHGSKAYALSRLLGHGSPETTFLYYVHTLDLLLYAATDRTNEHGDHQMQFAAIGLAASTRKRERSDQELIGPLLRKLPDRAIAHEPTASPEKLAHVARSTLDLEQLSLAWDETRLEAQNKGTGDSRGTALQLSAPQDPASRDAAFTTLEFLNAALARNHAAAEAAISLWTECKLKGEDWASMNGEQLRHFMAGICLDQSDASRIEIKRIICCPRTKKNTRTKLSEHEIVDLMAAVPCKQRYWIRLKDHRSASIRRKLESIKRKRQSTQRSVTWTVVTVGIMLGQ